MLTSASGRFTAQQHQILNAWRGVLGDIRHLCESLKGLPDKSLCGDGRSHLSGSCTCCNGVLRVQGRPKCEDCETLLARLTPAMNQLTVDTWQFFPSAVDFLELRGRQSVKVHLGDDRTRHFAAVARERTMSAVQRHIAAISDTFDRLIAAVDEFRIGCSVTHLHGLKAIAEDLFTELEGFDRAL